MALALCNACPVQAACLRTALEAGDCEGVWGATIPRERRAMLVAWRALTGDEDGDRLAPDPLLVSLLAPELRSSKRGSTRSPLHTRSEHAPRAEALEEAYR
jgi:hypothetical protein